MESEDFRRQKLIVPMNLRDSDSSAAACSVAARDSGAFVPVGEIGSDTRQYDCLVTPVRVFPLGRFAFSVWCVGRVGGGPKLVSKTPSARLGEGVVSFASDTPHQPICKNPNVFSVFRNARFMGRGVPTFDFALLVCASTAARSIKRNGSQLPTGWNYYGQKRAGSHVDRVSFASYVPV